MAKRARRTLITLTDSKGVDHDFEPVELFTVGKKNFALLQPANAKKNEVAIFRFTLDKKGNAQTFTPPTEKEFDQALEALESEIECGCDCCCEDEADCCHEPEKKPAKKAAKKATKPAKKAGR